LISAMESLHEGISSGLIPMLQTLQLTPWELILSQLINQLEVITEPFVLVLDDYQFINFKLVHEMVAFLLNNLPPNFHLIIATRSEPPLPLARLRTRGQFYELRESDLRFVPEEANELFNQVMGLNLSSAEISTLENRTEGWALGLQMAGIALHSLTGSRNQFIQSFSGSHKYILDYLVDEVLGHQSQEIQSFLLQTSILDRLNSSLCDLIIEDREKERSSTSQVQLSPETTSSTLFTNSQQILEHLEQSNLFLIPLDDERRWFRYHHLFADLLLSRLRQSQPLRERILHIRAMGWYEQEGMINEAVRHAIAAKDYEQTVRLINLHALTTIANGEMHTVQSWLNALPKGEALHQPWLEIYQAWIWLLLGQVEGVESMLDHVEKIIPKNTFETEDMLGNLALLRSEIVLLNGKSDQSLQLLKDAQKFLSKKSVIPRWLIPLVMGDAYLFIGDMEKASLFYEEACDLSRKIGNVFISLMSLDTLAFIYQFQGSLHEAERIFQEAIRLGTDKSGKHSILLGGPLIGYSDVFYERNDLEMARMYAEEGIKGAEQLGRANLLVHGYVALAQVLQAQGDFEKTGEAIQKAEQWIRSRKVYPLTASRLINVKLNYWMATGKLGEINGWVSAYRLKKDGNLIHPAILELIAQARKFFFQKEDRRALNLLMCLEKIVETKGLISSLVQIRLLLALILLRNGDIDESMIVFKKCITLAEPCGYMRTFIDEGSQVIRLFDEYQKRTDDGRLQADQKLTLYLEKIRHAF
jgi:LuxR family maltose regulon positive regulatory protein